jgi:protein-tyrosine-phosphatase
VSERGYDLTRHWSKGLADVPDMEFNVLVTFGCADACLQIRARRCEDWGLPVPKDMPPEEFRAVRDHIEEKVKELLAEHGMCLLTGDEASAGHRR